MEEHLAICEKNDIGNDELTSTKEEDPPIVSMEQEQQQRQSTGSFADEKPRCQYCKRLTSENDNHVELCKLRSEACRVCGDPVLINNARNVSDHQEICGRYHNLGGLPLLSSSSS